MYKGNRARFFPLVVILIVIVIAVFGLISLGRWVIGSLGSNNSQTTTSQASSTESALLSSDSSNSVQMTVRGPIVGDEQFRSYQVTISPTSRSITTWSGYDKTSTLGQINLGNNQKAYDEFVHALDYAGFTKTQTTKESDTSGLCANGRVYHFDILEGNEAAQDTWATNCGIKGTFNGNGPSVRSLFLSQIDGADSLVGTIGL